MGKAIFFSIYHLANALLFLSFLLFLFNFFKFKEEKNYKILTIYLLISVLAVSFFELKRNNLISMVDDYTIFKLLYNYLHFLIFYIIISQECQFSILKYSLAILILTIAYIFMSFYDYHFKTIYSTSITNIALILTCILYYYYLLVKLPLKELKHDETFLIIKGVFLSSGLLMPIYLFSDQISHLITADTFYFVAIIAPISSLILYSYFIKSFICLMKRKK
jgi:hypothetical protein